MTAPIILGRDLVMPELAGFLASHPLISVEVRLDDRMVDLQEGDYHLAIRVGRPGDNRLVARRLGWAQEMAVASPAYLSERGTPSRPSELAGHQVIGRPTLDAAVAAAFRDPGKVGASAPSIATRWPSILRTAQSRPRAPDMGFAGPSIMPSQPISPKGVWCGPQRLRTGFPTDFAAWPSYCGKLKRVRLLIDHLAERLSILRTPAHATRRGEPTPRHRWP